MNTKQRFKEAGGRKQRIKLFCRTRNPKPISYTDIYSDKKEPTYSMPQQPEEWQGVDDLFIYEVPYPKAVRLLAGTPGKFFPVDDIISVEMPRGDGGYNLEKLFPYKVVVEKEIKGPDNNKLLELKKERAVYDGPKDAKGKIIESKKVLVQIERTLLVPA